MSTLEEDNPKLTIELVPETCWYSNLRSDLPKEQWDKLRRTTYRKAGYRCEICGGQGDMWPVECHEIWHYDDRRRHQTLKGLIALCPMCHKVKHIGLADVHGQYEQAKAHLMRVNQWDDARAEQYIKQAFRVWRQRSKRNWQSNISWVNRALVDDGEPDRHRR